MSTTTLSTPETKTIAASPVKLILSRETLLKPLQWVMGAVERKQTLPILSNVLIKIENQQLSITGTDLEVELIGKTSLNYAGAKTGQFTVPGRKLFDILKALPENAPLEMDYDAQRVTLKSGRSRFTLSSLPANDFPYFEPQKKHLSFSISQKDLLSLIQTTSFAMAQQDVRYYLNGMLLEANANSLRAVATDGHRLATRTITAIIKEAGRLQVILPRKGVVELTRLLEDSTSEIAVSIGSNYLQLETSHLTLTSKLIDGRFPDYKRVIPRGGDKVLTVKAEELKQALSRAAILCNEKFKSIRFELRPGALRLSANNPEHEVAEEELTVDYQQSELDIGFNVNYLLDVLNTMGDATVKLIFTDANSSVLIEQAGENKPDSLFVVMPMRL